MNYAALQASDGAGEAVRATVQSPGRDIGSSVIPVNALTNYPTGTFIGTTGTLQANNTLANAQVFYGTASGTDITITSFAPGYTDLGNSAGDVVVIKPTTEWANIISDFIKTGVFNAIYPVGCIYAETTGVNPNTTFGVGTWMAFGGGRVLVGAGTSDETFTAGATGGESNHTLTTTEIPSHTHTLGAAGSTKLQGSGANMSPLVTDGGNANSGATGSGGAHNNLQPYIVVYFWKRTA